MSANQLLQRRKPLVDNGLNAQPLFARFLHAFGNETLDNAGKRTAFLLSSRRHVSHGFRIKATSLPAGRVNPSVRCQVGMDGNAAPFQGDQPHQA